MVLPLTHAKHIEHAPSSPSTYETQSQSLSVLEIFLSSPLKYDTCSRSPPLQVYTPNDRFPKGGKMSQMLDALDIGDTIDIKGPVGEIVYLEPGQFLIKGKPRNANKLAMLAGGTGITPMYQVIKAVLSDPADTTVCSLIYANQMEEDILLRDEVREVGGGGGSVGRRLDD